MENEMFLWKSSIGKINFQQENNYRNAQLQLRCGFTQKQITPIY